MNPRGYILLALIAIAAVLVLIALYRSPPASDPMRTADQRKIERETAKLQRQVPDPHRAGCDVEAVRNVASLCKERARRDARHQARVQDLDGTPPVNPYHPSDSAFIYWAIELSEARTEIFHAKHPINQYNH